MSLPDFRRELDKRVLVCDGAMGTMLYARGIFLNRSFDDLNLTQPDLVAEVHQAYAHAGADILETNTFGANRIKLATFGLADRVHAINVQGAKIARHAARDHAYVAGAIGPLGIRIEPWGRTGIDEAEQHFREQARRWPKAASTCSCSRRFATSTRSARRFDAVRSVSDLPIVAQMTTEEDGNTLDGTPPETFVPDLEARGADVVGVNCASGRPPCWRRSSASPGRRASGSPPSRTPDSPREIEGRNIYLCSPEYMASYARRFINSGVRFVGGCCGTTPEHIRHIKMAVRSLCAGITSA